MASNDYGSLYLLMPENKNQHYVPKFYLKNFSVNNDEKSIGLYNKKNKIYVKSAPIKSQGKEDYFYSKNTQIEKGLTEVENLFLKVLSEIKNKQTLPKYMSEDYHTLFVYTLIQSSRTLHSVNETQAYVKSMFDHFQPENDNIYYINEPAVFNLVTALKKPDALLDLKVKLVINHTNTPFITSDHPVVKYNQFTEHKSYPLGSLGMASKGLQLFFPLTPSLLLMLYDSKIYKTRPAFRRTIKVNNLRDIHQLNLLQMANCSEQVFFNEYIDKDLIENNYTEINKSTDRQYGYEEADNSNISEGLGTLLKTKNSDLRINLTLSFTSLKRSARKIDLLRLTKSYPNLRYGIPNNI